MNDVNIQLLFAKLNTEVLVSYLRAQGWTEKVGGSPGRMYFEGAVHAGGKPYELMIPSSPSVSKYGTLMRRAIYKLCGIQDCEPAEIIQAILQHEADSQPLRGQTRNKLKLRNSSESLLQVRIPSRNRDLELFPGETVELVFDLSTTEAIEIEHGEDSITIHNITAK